MSSVCSERIRQHRRTIFHFQVNDSDSNSNWQRQTDKLRKRSWQFERLWYLYAETSSFYGNFKKMIRFVDLCAIFFLLLVIRLEQFSLQKRGIFHVKNFIGKWVFIPKIDFIVLIIDLFLDDKSRDNLQRRACIQM